MQTRLLAAVLMSRVPAFAGPIVLKQKRSGPEQELEKGPKSLRGCTESL